MALSWSYGVTTVNTRLHSTLPRTLSSLRKSGYDSPRLFIDGVKDVESLERRFGLEVTARHPAVRTAGNWILSLWELYLRNPDADRYALFQDDFVTSLNLRAYLERVPYPDKGYLNLYTFPSNQRVCPRGKDGPEVGFFPAADLDPSTPGFQTGRGAVALVFDNLAAMVLLCHPHMVRRCKNKAHGWKKIDGGIVESLNQAGFKEYVHNPSLVQHTGSASSIGNKPHPQAVSFMGEGFDLLDLLTQP